MSDPIDIEQADYLNYISVFAEHFKAKLAGNLLHIPQQFGSGFMWAERLPNGMTVLVVHATLKQELNFTQFTTILPFYTLQFNEYVSELPAKRAGRKSLELEQQSAIRLTHTLVSETFTFPQDVLIKSVSFFFNREQLASLLGQQAVEEVLTNYFPYQITNKKLEPIATGYRVSLNDLQVEKIEVPLRLNFIQNRVLLLLENFLVNLHAKKEVTSDKIKRSDNETLRLMKVEALLVSNFSVKPLTIDELSRISAMSPTKLKNDFKHLYGFPIYVYFQKNRMLKAKALILMRKYSIKEVGVMVGYRNLSHFATTFKKEFNLLPSEITAKDGVLVYNT